MSSIEAKDYCVHGCMEMFGAHIRCCIDDYSIKRHIPALKKQSEDLTLKCNKIDRKKKRKNGKVTTAEEKAYAYNKNLISRIRQVIRNFETAESYLFNGQLERDIHDFGMTILEPSAVRAEAERMTQEDDNPFIMGDSRRTYIRNMIRTAEGDDNEK
jgi:hypothetical protein